MLKFLMTYDQVRAFALPVSKGICLSSSSNSSKVALKIWPSISPALFWLCGMNPWKSVPRIFANLYVPRAFTLQLNATYLVLIIGCSDAFNIEKIAFSISLKIFADLSNIYFLNFLVCRLILALDSNIKEYLSIKQLPFDEPFLCCREKPINCKN